MPKLGRVKPCADCPFLRKSQRGWLGEDKPVHFYRVSVTQEQEMPCHLEIDYEDPDWKTTQLPDADFCAGNLIHYRNTFKVPRRESVAEAVRGAAVPACVRLAGGVSRTSRSRFEGGHQGDDSAIHAAVRRGG